MNSRLPMRLDANDLIALAKNHANSIEPVRLAVSELLLAQSRNEGRDSDAEIFQASGYGDAAGFWRVALSEPMLTSEFTRRLALHHLPGAWRADHDRRTKERWELDMAMRLAQQSNQPFFVPGTDRENPLLDPLAAALWLLSLPLRRHLVPATLRACLETGPDTTGSHNSEAGDETKRLVHLAAQELLQSKKIPQKHGSHQLLAEALQKDDRFKGHSVDTLRRYSSGAHATWKKERK
jgi:hypothetical protein